MEKKQQKKRIERWMGLIMIAAAFFLAAKAGQLKQAGLNLVGNTQAKEVMNVVYTEEELASNKMEKKTVVIDAGHGGDDPGKIGVNEALEKDVNLAIAEKLKGQLEKQDINVVMTRSDENGLYDEDSKNHKVQDLQRRCDVIDQAQPIAAVSIHQNSYPSEAVKGPQVFYYGQSKSGKELAEHIQNSLVAALSPERARQEKANETYYLLKKTSAPAVIVECGFLSNWEEAKLLVTEDYQQKVAEAICQGILEYVGQNTDANDEPSN